MAVSREHGNRRPRGSVNRPVALLLATFVIVIALIAMLALQPQPDQRPVTLLVYCAAGLKGPLEEIRTAYEREREVSLELQFGGSQSLLASLEVSRQGDLFISADEQHLVTAQARKLAGKSYPIASQHPVLAVRKGNPLKLDSIEALLASDAKLAIANPNLAAIGQTAKEALTKTGEWEQVLAKATVITTTVSEVANSLKVGAVDAGIVWDQTVHQYQDSLQAVHHVQQFEGISATLAVGVLTNSKQPDEAAKFARYLAESRDAHATLKRYGFSPVAADHPDTLKVQP